MRLTTCLLIALVLLLILCNVATAQITLKQIKEVAELSFRSSIVSHHQQDTLKRKLLISIDEIEFNRGNVYTITGYEVTQLKGDTWTWWYLDKNKIPLDSGVTVWGSQPFKP